MTNGIGDRAGPDLLPGWLRRQVEEEQRREAEQRRRLRPPPAPGELAARATTTDTSPDPRLRAWTRHG